MSNDNMNNKRLNEAMAGMAVLVEELLISKGAVISDLRGRLAVAEGQAKDARASTDVACRQVDEARRVLGLEVNVGLLDGLRRVISKQLAESQKVEPVSYADEFDAAEDIARLRRERDEALARSEAAKKAEEYLKERDEARADLARAIEHAASQREVTDKLASTIGAVWDALGDNSPLGFIDEAVAAQRRELLELRCRRDELVKEQEEVRNVIDWSGPLPRGGLPEAVERIVSNRDTLLAQLEVAEKKAQAFPGAELEAAQEELTHLKAERATLVKELGKAQDSARQLDSDLTVLAGFSGGDDLPPCGLYSGLAETVADRIRSLRARLEEIKREPQS